MTSLVFVHGFMGGSRQWVTQKNELSKNYKIVDIDLPGFGKNAHIQSPDSISGYAQFVLQHLTENGIEAFHLVGHSMGGMVVQEMVALAPQRIQKLVLYGTAASGNLPNRFETFEQSRRRATDDGARSTARRISATWFLEREKAGAYEQCAQLAECCSMQAIQAALDAMELWSRRDNLGSIPSPTLVIWGDRDRTYAWQQIEELWAGIPGASLAVIPNCAHAVHLEKPEIFNNILSDFLT